MNLIVAEFIIASYSIPVDFKASLDHGWKLGKEFCLTTGFILTFLGQFAVYLLCTILLSDI